MLEASQSTNTAGLIVRTLGGNAVLELPMSECFGLSVMDIKLKISDSTGVAPHRQVLASTQRCLIIVGIN